MKNKIDSHFVSSDDISTDVMATMAIKDLKNLSTCSKAFPPPQFLDRSNNFYIKNSFKAI